MIKNEKLKNICDFLFDGRLAVSVMFIYTALLSTMLGKVGFMYLFPLFTTTWFLTDTKDTKQHFQCLKVHRFQVWVKVI